MEGAESFVVECEAESKLYVTATVFRHTISEAQNVGKIIVNTKKA
jgi:hypothetical protein